MAGAQTCDAGKLRFRSYALTTESLRITNARDSALLSKSHCSRFVRFYYTLDDAVSAFAIYVCRRMDPHNTLTMPCTCALCKDGDETNELSHPVVYQKQGRVFEA